jgi:hypothetical protein
MTNAKYKEGQLVWLAEFEENPREQATIVEVSKDEPGDVMYIVDIEGDITEVPEDQIEGLV